MAVLYLRTLSNFLKHKRIQIQVNLHSSQSNSIIQNPDGDSAESSKVLKGPSALRTYRWLYLSGTFLWISNFLMSFAMVLPIIDIKYINLAAVLWRLSNMMLPVQLISTLFFTKAVRKLMKSMFPTKEQFRDAYVGDLKSFSPEVERIVVNSSRPNLKPSMESPESIELNHFLPNRWKVKRKDQNHDGTSKVVRKAMCAFDFISQTYAPVTDSANASPMFVLTGSEATLNSQGISESFNNTRSTGSGLPRRNETDGANEYMVIFSYAATQDDELTLCRGDVVRAIEVFDDGWAMGSLVKPFDPRLGMFPLNICKLKLQPS
ncbi:hypothetical protein HK098_001460 [Nowakowskiella sp. JEL0407]|nr:hypothetical protein HK098_001460 [Nowakowskiella sp. JEL0407]